jgi:Leucine-rich repeat (LRR) protein
MVYVATGARVLQLPTLESLEDRLIVWSRAVTTFRSLSGARRHRWIVVLLSMIFCSSLAATAAYSESFCGENVTDATVKETLAKNSTLRSVKFFKTPSITDQSLAALSGQCDLEIISMICTNVTGTGLKHLSDLPKLNRLELEVCQLSETGLKNLPTLRLKTVNFVESTVDDRGAWYIGYSPTLEEVHLSKTRITDTGVSYLVRLPSLKYLYLEGTTIGDQCVPDLLKLTKLQLLDLRNTNLSDAGVKKIASLPKLNKLYLGGPLITDSAVMALKETNLETLSLSGSLITDKALEIAVAMQKLKNLEIYRTAVSSEAIRKFKRARPEVLVTGVGPDDLR